MTCGRATFDPRAEAPVRELGRVAVRTALSIKRELELDGGRQVPRTEAERWLQENDTPALEAEDRRIVQAYLNRTHPGCTVAMLDETVAVATHKAVAKFCTLT